MEVKDLLRHMLHIVPQKRPTAAQILRHSWIWQPPMSQTDNRNLIVVNSNQMSGGGGGQEMKHDQTAALRGAVNATFRAIASPQAANVGPVAMSELARRRQKDKVTHTHF